MILSKSQILKELNNSIYISPFDEKKLNSNSYNLTLANTLKFYNDYELDMKKPYDKTSLSEIEIPPEGFVLQPHILYLGSTVH